MKCKERINNSTLSLQNRNTILLPSNHRFTELLILQSHSKAQRSGVNGTLVLLRECYWILKGRQAVRKVCKSRATCKRLQGAFYPTVSSPDLPHARVSKDPPFAHTRVVPCSPLQGGYLRQGLYLSFHLCIYSSRILGISLQHGSRHISIGCETIY